jgi:hypothetical protein
MGKQPMRRQHCPYTLGHGVEKAIAQRRIEGAEPVEIGKADDAEDSTAILAHLLQQRLSGWHSSCAVAPVRSLVGIGAAAFERIDGGSQASGRIALRRQAREPFEPIGK